MTNQTSDPDILLSGVGGRREIEEIMLSDRRNVHRRIVQVHPDTGYFQNLETFQSFARTDPAGHSITPVQTGPRHSAANVSAPHNRHC
jgi:hypothetical protein